MGLSGSEPAANTPPPFTRRVRDAGAGGLVLTPDGDYELRVQDDELAALVLPPRGFRGHVRILSGEGAWTVRPLASRWTFAAKSEEDREPAAVFRRRPLRAAGRFTVRGGAELDVGRTRRPGWTLRDGDLPLLDLYAPTFRHREQIMRFERLGECPVPALLVPFAMWIAIEIDRQDRRLWRHGRRDDPDRTGFNWGDNWWGGGDGGGGDGGGGGGGDEWRRRWTRDSPRIRCGGPCRGRGLHGGSVTMPR